MRETLNTVLFCTVDGKSIAVRLCWIAQFQSNRTDRLEIQPKTLTSSARLVPSLAKGIDVKPVNQKPNRLDRLDLIMADQEALGMNEETESVAKPNARPDTNGHSERNRAQARQLLHYLTDEIGTNDASPSMPSREAVSPAGKQDTRWRTS